MPRKRCSERTHHAHQCRLHARVLPDHGRTGRRHRRTARRVRLHAALHGHRAPPGGGLLVHPAPVQQENLRSDEGHGRDGAPHPVQGHRALPGRPRVPPRLRLRPAPRGAHPAAARLRVGAAVRARGHVHRRGRLPREVLRVQRRRLLGHEREPRDHHVGGAVRDVQALLRAPSGAGLRAVRIVGAGVPGHLRHLRAARRQPAHRHLRLPRERRGRRVPHLRRPVPPARRGMRRGRRARAGLRRRGAARQGRAARGRHLAPLRDERRHRPLGRLAGAAQRRARRKGGAHRQLRRAHRARQADFQGAVRRAHRGVPRRRRDLLHRGDGADDGLPRRRLHQRAANPREQGRMDHQAHRSLRRRRRVRRLLGLAGGVGSTHRQVRERPRRLPLHRAALHPPLQDRDAAARRGHRRAARRRGVRRTEALQQPERPVPLRRHVHRRVQPPRPPFFGAPDSAPGRRRFARRPRGHGGLFGRRA